MPNYSFQNPDLPNNSVITVGNFSQFVQNTEIMKGKTLTINGGNFCNVKKQPEWTINGGLWVSKSFCSHLHPSWISKGLSVCELECEHMISVENNIYKYEDINL
ncbi:MAG: hypothetical protein GY845_03390 [Planctomycetes bacterium]|nr:hypothetical protein [Planctomycetota bacterium]